MLRSNTLANFDDTEVQIPKSTLGYFKRSESLLVAYDPINTEGTFEREESLGNSLARNHRKKYFNSSLSPKDSIEILFQ
jgi:hypothetical protein